MRTRLFKILDYGTEMYCLVTQFEEIDKEKCKKIGIPTNYKIINVFRASYVSTFAGYDFNPEYFENRIYSDKYEGTIKAIGNILKEVKDLKYLPETIDVFKTREYYNYIKGGSSNLNDILNEIENYNTKDLRKIIYRSIGSISIVIYDVVEKSQIYWVTSSWDIKEILPVYLWIPVKKISKLEIEAIEVSPFKYEILCDV